MDEFISIIFRNAVLREKAAFSLYSKLAEKAKVQDIRDLFKKLAEEEYLHMQLFLKSSTDILKKVNREELSGLNLLKDTVSPEEDINDALDLAIEEEQKAIDDYERIAYFMTGEVKEAFEEIIVQEKRHKTALQKVKLEFNRNDWKKL